MTDLTEGIKTVYTTGQVAKVCEVAPRTVSKWFDSGRLEGYRIPGSNDRRITRFKLVQFLRDNQMPIGGLEEIGTPYRVVYIGNDSSFGEKLCRHGKFTVTHVPCPDDAEQAVMQALPMCVAIDWSLPDAGKAANLINMQGPYRKIAFVMAIITPQMERGGYGFDALDYGYEVTSAELIDYANFAEVMNHEIVKKYFR